MPQSGDGSANALSARALFGFIAPETGGKDEFLHISALERAGTISLDDDQKVTFDVEAGRDGREAAQTVPSVEEFVEAIGQVALSVPQRAMFTALSLAEAEGMSETRMANAGG